MQCIEYVSKGGFLEVCDRFGGSTRGYVTGLVDVCDMFGGGDRFGGDV